MTHSTGRYVELLRGGWGTVLSIAPRTVLRMLRLHVDRWSVTVARILGVRHCLQALLSGYRPSGPVLALGVWVDMVHALTSATLVVIDRDRARLGVVDAVVASSWGLAGWRDLRRSTQSDTSGGQRVRDRLALCLLRIVPGGRYLRRELK